MARKFIEIEIMETPPISAAAPGAHDYPVGLTWVRSNQQLVVNPGNGAYPTQFYIPGWNPHLAEAAGGLGLHLSEEMAVKFYACAFGKPMP